MRAALLVAAVLAGCAASAPPPATMVVPRIVDDTPVSAAPSSAPPDVTPAPLVEEPPAPAEPSPPDPPPAPPAPPPPVATTNAPLAAAIASTCPPSNGAGPPSGLSVGARPRWQKTRPLALLITEIHQLEQLEAATPRGAKDRPVLLLRIAAGYYELEAAAYGECAGATVPVGASTAQIAQADLRVRDRARLITAARAAARKQCVELRRDHAQFAATRPCPTQ